MSKDSKNNQSRCGRRAAAWGAYMERWAARYPQSQEAVERDRLAKGAAKHRAHLFPLTAQSLQVSA